MKIVQNQISHAVAILAGRALDGQNVLFCSFSADRHLPVAAAPNGGYLKPVCEKPYQIGDLAA